MTAEPAIVVQGLTFRHPPTASGRVVTALKEVNLSIFRGEVVGIAGVSGSGKSTFCYCLNGLIPHHIPGVMNGTVTVLGMDTRSWRVTDLAARVGLVFQNPEDQLFSSDVESEIAFGPEQMGWPEEQIEGAIEHSMEVLDIKRLRKRDIGELSWGERQRVAIASAIAVRPEILILDEPFSGIDKTTSLRLVGLVLGLNRSSGTTIILTEQRLNWLVPVANRLVVFDQGTVIYDGDSETLPSWYKREEQSYSVSTSLINDKLLEKTAVISIRDLVFHYPGRKQNVLSIQRLDIFQGEITVIQGPNGSGKSTLIRHLNGILKQDSGELQIGGQDVRGKSTAELSRTVGILFQHADYQLFAETIYDELAFGPENLRVPDPQVKERVEEIAATLSIDRLGLKTPPLGLSSGEKQRVAIGSLLTMKTPIVVLDEPTLGLDRRCKRTVGEVLKKLRDSGASVIVATHDEEFSQFISDRTIILERGAVASDTRAGRGKKESAEKE
jgi:energy-coupling factor transporter ATP-binding protein EcfA2